MTSEKQKSRLPRNRTLNLGKSEVKTSEKPRVIRLSIVILTGVKKEYIPKKNKSSPLFLGGRLTIETEVL